MITLRDYQQAAADRIRMAYRSGASRPIFVAPTGSGKTVLFAYMAQQAAERGNNTLILVHRQELLNQTSRTLDQFDVRHGIIARGMTHTQDRVQVASVQTLVRRLSLMRWRPTWIVVDEAHHAVTGSTWGKVLAHFSDAKVLGVTATPERLDGRGLGEAFDTLIMGPTVRELIDAGHLSRPVVYAPSRPDMSGVHTRAGDFARDELDELMDRPSITGDAVAHYGRLCRNEPAIAFCTSIKHAEHTAEQFRAAGYQAASIDGTLDDRTRRERITDLGSGRLHVLTSCEIISEGTDIPVVSAAILLRPTQSLALALQQMGRAMRIHPGKTRAVILDHAGNVWRHGLPDEDREWSLEGRPRTKRKSSDDETALPIRQCEQCYTVHRPAPRCPSCGYVYPVQERKINEVAGTLEEVRQDEIRRHRRMEVGMAKTMGELIALGRQRGYKNPQGWAYMTMQMRSKRKAA